MSVITAGRKRQQQQTQTQAPRSPNNAIMQNGTRVSSLLPSGMVACNECGDVYATFAQSLDHYNNTHASGQQALTYGSEPQT